jgi:aryl-alcohol dehydrogenase-like predicted oxidoreductase
MVLVLFFWLQARCTNFVKNNQIVKTLTIGNTGQEISCIGLGTMYFGSKTNEQDSFAMLDYYTDAGGFWLDSANKYASWVPGFQGGESEKLIGKWMKERGNRKDVFITSKVGFPYGDVPRSLKKEIIIYECERSLKRLQTDRIDLYFAHAFDSATPLDETIEAFYLLKKAGKIRLAGASNFYSWQLCEANTIAHQQGWQGFCCIQHRHTYLEPTLRADFGTQLLLTPEIQEFCQTRNICMMAYSPLLSGTYVRNNHPVPVQYQSKINEFRLTKLREVAEELQVSPNAVVLAWMMHGSQQIIPIVTGSTVAQLEENLASLSLKLNKAQLERLNQEVVQPNKYS